MSERRQLRDANIQLKSMNKRDMPGKGTGLAPVTVKSGKLLTNGTDGTHSDD